MTETTTVLSAAAGALFALGLRYVIESTVLIDGATLGMLLLVGAVALVLLTGADL